MKVIGFNFDKISAEKSKITKKTQISTNIEFQNVEKEDIQIFKDSEVIKLDFKFLVAYKESQDKSAKPQASVEFHGVVVISVDKKESKDILEAWKKKTVPNVVKMPLLNVILKKCSIKALSLEEELGLPTHMPLPKLAPKN